MQPPFPLTVRLLPFDIADGPRNMASDEVLLSTAVEGQASFRLYGWSQATVSLGYFQPAAVRLQDPKLATLPWVRRSTGGATLVHHRELTYALALPAYVAKLGDWMPRIHAILADALASLGFPVQPVETESLRGDLLCFQKQTKGDLLAEGNKIVGSAQRKHRQCLLQHGAILLERCEHAPELPGLREILGRSPCIEELGSAIIAAFEKATGWSLSSSYWWPDEMQRIEALIEDKYALESWNAKR